MVDNPLSSALHVHAIVSHIQLDIQMAHTKSFHHANVQQWVPGSTQQ